MPQKSLDSERFLQVVQKSGIVDAHALERLIEKVRDQLGGQLPGDASKLATLLKKKNLLTAWHCEKLLAGKYKGFFLGKHMLLGHIGTGGMSSVYLAQHVGLGHKRAIKVLPKSRVADATYLARFQLEAKAIASLNHPNIVQAHDIDNQGDIHYIVMEHVNGLDLQQLVKRDGPLDYAVAADLIAQAARGLQHAHYKGVIHRDVKPANLLVDPSGVVKLLDMGLALVRADQQESLTVVNHENVLGTADYLAPEQALDSHGVDHRADIYGLGCTFYYLLTGKPPFGGGTLAQRIAKHQTEMPTLIRTYRPDCPQLIEQICGRMIQKDPQARFQSADQVASVLDQFAAMVPHRASALVGAGDSADDGTANWPGLGLGDNPSSVKLGSDDLATSDTVSNKVGQTMSQSRSRILRDQDPASGDSQRMPHLKTRAPVTGDSMLDLQLESGYRPHCRPPSSSMSGPGASDICASDISASDISSGGISDGGLSTVSLDQHARRPAGTVSKPTQPNPTPPLGRRRAVKRLALGVLVTVFFFIAAAIGFMLARWTS